MAHLHLHAVYLETKEGFEVDGNSANRGGTSAVASGATVFVAAAGGVGGSGTGGTAGASPGSQTAYGQTYTGGGTAPSGSGRTHPRHLAVDLGA